MSKKVELEYELKTRSGSAVWVLISTPIGLKKWLADDVTINEDVATFVWGDPLREHDIHTAKSSKWSRTTMYVSIGRLRRMKLIGR